MVILDNRGVDVMQIAVGGSSVGSSRGPAPPIRVLIADDHRVIRAGLASLLSFSAGMDVVAQADNGGEAIELWRRHRPDVTLMDLRMPRMGGVEAIQAIRDDSARAVIVILTTMDGDEDIFQGLRAGAKGYLVKDTSSDDLIACIRQVHAGRTYIPSDVATKLASRMSGELLTEREQQILVLVAHGESNKSAANRLNITEGTVKTHISSILAKLNAGSRTEAVAIAHKRGLISFGRID